MAPYLQLDLNDITIDTQLARQVPYALSRYYLALPIGQENGRVSVAMAFPDNEQARRILGHLLQARVVPLFVPAESLQPALERIHGPAQPRSYRMLAWSPQPQWETAVMTAAAALAAARGAQVTAVTMPALADVLAAGAHDLLVCPLPAGAQLPQLLTGSAASIYLVRGEVQPPQQIPHVLVVMRGFASDERALDWLLPFAGAQQAAVTLLPLANGPGLALNQYHRQDSPYGRHFAACLRRLRRAGVSVDLKFRQGQAVTQVVEEAAGNAYDLLLMAAEAEGSFVSEVITAIEQRQAHDQRPIFVLKPPEMPKRENYDVD